MSARSWVVLQANEAGVWSCRTQRARTLEEARASEEDAIAAGYRPVLVVDAASLAADLRADGKTSAACVAVRR